MGAVKQFYSECAEAGRCPVSQETLSYLDDVECGLHTGRKIDWIGYAEYQYEECITMESARRLVAEGLANEEIAFFVECFGDFAPASRCPPAAVTAARLAGEIVAAVAAGEELPEEWHRLDAYAEVGEPVAEEVCRLVRDDLEGTGIRP